jgi:type I restriction enzyme S subunit
VKRGWQRKKVSEIARHSLGKMLDKAKNKGEPRPYLRNLNVRWFGFDLSDVLEMRFLPEEEAKYTAIKGDVLVCEGGYPGRAAIWEQDEPIYFQKALHRVRFHQPEHNKWFLYYLHACDLDGTLRNYFSGTGIQHFTGEALSQFELPLPPLRELLSIVSILDEAFDGITVAKANAEKNLQNARSLFESQLEATFTFTKQGKGWIDTTIGQHIRFIDYRGKTPKKTESGLRLITAKNVKMGYVREAPMEFVAPETYDGWMTRGIPRRGDVLFTTEAPLANVAQLETDEKVVFAQRIIVMQPDAAKLDSTFLKYLLLSRPVQQRIRTKGTGATVQGIKASLLKSIEISFPSSLTMQRQIVTKLDTLREETRRLEAIHRRKLAALDELKRSLLHKAFAGEL